MTTSTLAYIPSPPQGVWYLGPLPIRAYALFIIVGIIVALVIGDRRWAARGGERGVIYDIALWAVPFGLVGGRLYHVITDMPTYFGDNGAGLAAAFRIWDGGLGIWGAVAFGGLGAWIACRRRGIPLPAFADAIAPGIVLAQAIGRLGNYFNQELYGRSTTLPWGLEIYERRDASGALDTLNGVSTGQLVDVVHPTFLYELLWNVLVFIVLILVDRRFRLGHGRVFALYVAGYCLGRFWIELLRSDAATLIAGIRINSFTSMFVFIGAVIYIMAAAKGREDPASLGGQAETDEELTESTAEDDTKELAAVGTTGAVVATAVAGGEEGDEGPSDQPPDEEVGAESDEPVVTAAELYDADETEAADAEAEPEATEPGAAAAEADGHEPEPVAEAEALTDDVAEAPSDEIGEAETVAAAEEDTDTDTGAAGTEAAKTEADAGAAETTVEPDQAEVEAEDDESVPIAEAADAPAAESEAGESEPVAEAEALTDDAGVEEQAGTDTESESAPQTAEPGADDAEAERADAEPIAEAEIPTEDATEAGPDKPVEADEPADAGEQTDTDAEPQTADDAEAAPEAASDDQEAEHADSEVQAADEDTAVPGTAPEDEEPAQGRLRRWLRRRSR